MQHDTQTAMYTKVAIHTAKQTKLMPAYSIACASNLIMSDSPVTHLIHVSGPFADCALCSQHQRTEDLEVQDIQLRVNGVLYTNNIS